MYAEAKSLPEELRTDDIIVRAFKELERVNADEKMRAILEQRDKEERTRITELNAALKKLAAKKAVRRASPLGVSRAVSRNAMRNAEASHGTCRAWASTFL